MPLGFSLTDSGGRMAKRIFFFCFSLLILVQWMDRLLTRARGKPARSAVVRLGERLFRDDRFSTPAGDLPASCSTCHLLDEDPQGLRAYADFFNRSWVSSRMRDHRRLELRNSPTIFDVAAMPRLHFDGEFDSLEALVRGTLAGRPMGWLPGEESQAFDRLRQVLLADRGKGRGGEGPYREQFRAAFNVNLDRIGRDEAMDLVARAVAAYMRTLNTRKDSPYDRFLALNKLETGPAAGESGPAFAARLLARIESLDSNRAIRLTPDFNAAELAGLKTFLDPATGNCAACHAPPLFADHSFHNLGVSQREYDRIHGEGRFAALPIVADRRPAPQFREIPSKDKPGFADLGHWNFVDVKRSSLRRPDESDERFLQRMIATFKTPGLRNLKYSQPYFHDGSLHTLEDVLEEIQRLSEMARAGRLREADAELAKIRLRDADIRTLAAFLTSLNEDLKKGY
jgi:cytochrome c peroxidase